MSERMTDDEAGRHIGTVIAASHAEVRTKAAVALSKEIARAHVSEDQKDAVIKALADALVNMTSIASLFNRETDAVWQASLEETRAALRLAGRL